jgi:hypothetical protein
MLKYLKWFWFLLKAMILHKADIKVSFTKESNGRWYVDFPNWPLSHDNLEMVAGADDLLDILNNGTNHVSLEVYTNRPKEYDIELKKVHSALTKGAFYTVETSLKGWENPNSIRRKQLWLCPVTLTVLGQYPQQIFFKQI